VDLQPLFFRLTLDTTTAFLFAESVYSLRAAKEAGETAFTRAFNTAQAYMAKRYRLQDLYWLIRGKELTECCTIVHDFADAILDRTLDQGGSTGKERDSRYTFLDAVAESTPDRKALRHQMINILVAGRDTTACLLSWTLSVASFQRNASVEVSTNLVNSRLLVRHPDVLKKLREEVSSVVGNASDFDRDDLHKMEYLTMVLKESEQMNYKRLVLR
jgi:cytochrome P450